MTLFNIKKDLDHKLAARFVLKYCSMRESKLYNTDAVTRAAIETLQKAYLKNPVYANTALKALKNKYSDTDFPESLESPIIE